MSDTPDNEQSQHPNVVINLADRRRAVEIGDILSSEEQDDDLTAIYNGTDFDNAEEVLNKMNRRHAVILNCEGFKEPMITTMVERGNGHPELRFIPPSALMFMYCNQLVSAGDKTIELGRWWLKCTGRREYTATTFEPGKPRDIGDKFNTWQGFAVEPKKGDWQLIKKHIYEVLANNNPDRFKYIIRWFAWTLQNPDKQAETALVFKGMQGCGKGTIFSAFVRIFGTHGRSVAGASRLTGRFNKFLAKTVFLFADEAFHAGDSEAESILKTLITEAEFATEGKGQEIQLTKNYLHIVMASNNEWVVPMGGDSRRFFVNSCTNKYAKGQATDDVRKLYFDKVHGQLQSGGTEAMLHDLLYMDLKGWHPRNDIPTTEETFIQQEISLGHTDKALYEFLKDGVFPVPANDKGELLISAVSLKAYLDEIHIPLKKVTNQKFGRSLEKFSLQKRRLAKGNFYVIPSLENMRGQWDKMHFAHKWEEPIEWRFKYSTEPF